MKIIILILSLVIITNLNLSYSKEIKSYKDAKSIEDYRYINFLLVGKTEIIPEDNDRYINGSLFIQTKNKEIKRKLIKNKTQEQKQQPTKFKSTYLDFTILQEENIS